MHLKRMELFGFKSFAEKSELEFSPGIAAVIGPNGCGKSNLVDAVRWALGEQSVKSLRGNRMEEVIFSGSENRKPLNFAEVSLTFAEAGEFLNLDYDEITITRRLFRNGESEYYINKSPCRLKDISELFIDTGLGKDVYSVIGQGRVDEIINSRPEERREIFEEAAGILKYKLRKREARRRLEETRENLVRVQDLIFELETQIDPLRDQAEVTRQYRDLKEKIDREEKKLLSYHLKQARDQLNRVNKQLQNVSEALVTAAAQGGLHEAEVQKLKNDLQEKQNQKKEKEQSLNQVSRAIEYQESELRLFREREERFREQIEQSRQRFKQLELLIEELKAQKKRAEEDLEERKDSLLQIEQELAALRLEMEELESKALPGEVEELREMIYRAAARREAAASAIEELKRRLERVQSQKELLNREEASLREKLMQSEKRAEEQKARVSELGKEVAAAAATEKEKTEETEKARLELERIQEEEQQKKDELHDIISRINLLQEQDLALSGYYRGVKEVMQARSKLLGIVGPVAELISVDEEYIQAIESALGSSMQYLVAESEQAVFGAISYLKDNKRGWATFLPLDVLHQGADPLERYPGWRDLDGVIGKASELVKVDRAYRKAVDYLMSSILVCRSLEHASHAARYIEHSCRVVTLEGEMINPGGIIRGGSLPRHSAGMPLSRRKEIETLSARKSTVEQGLAGIKAIVERQKKEFEENQKNLHEAADRRREITDLLNMQQKETENTERELDNFKERLQAAGNTAQELRTEEDEINRRMNELQQEIDTSEQEITKSETNLAGKKENYQRYLEQKKNLDQKITAVLVRISSYREQCDALAKRIEEIEEDINKPAAEKLRIEQEREKHEKELAGNREEQERIKQKIEKLNEEKAGLIADLETGRKEVNQIEAGLIELEEQARRRQNQVSRQEKRERQLSLEQTRLETEINYQEMRFRELFKTLDPVRLDENFDPEECRLLVENLKEDLETLGEVNLGAIEELARLEERINFLKDQKDDLQKGEVSLRKVLAEIDQRMEYYFNDAFEKINNNFEKTFRELFEGGQVILKLTDSENILEAGIDIVAQPPGKKLQNITLLSAGEKVLTAIALVFAILRFKPAPFYLLDEVESTLDDANLARFTRFLKQASEQAQFILITHRKRTMEEAEVLYGVTMPEPGVSRLMSLKIENQKIAGETGA